MGRLRLCRAPGRGFRKRHGLHRPGVAARTFGLVMFLDEQPVLAPLARARLHAHQNETTMQPCAIEDEFQLALREGGVHVLLHRLPGAAVPYFHRAGAVIARRDRALEPGVIDRMVLDMHGKALVGGIERGAFRHRPAQQHAVMLQAKIPVQAGGVVLLHDENPGPGRLARAGRRRFGRDLEVALGAVGADAAVHGAATWVRPGGSGKERGRVFFPEAKAAKGLLLKGFC
jgi:hypothetical protein